MKTLDADLTCGLVGAAGMLAAVPGMPVPIKVLLGVPLVLFLPGFAVVRAVLPSWSPVRPETLLAVLGTSLAMSVCVATVLAATVGLSGPAFALTLGAITIAAAVAAHFKRTGRPASRTRRPAMGTGRSTKSTGRSTRRAGRSVGHADRPWLER